jgi:hypothetical protein
VTDGTNGLNPTSDDDFDRAIRSLTDGTAGEARYRELSHAEREKQARRQARSRERQSGNGRRIRSRVKRGGLRITTAVLVAGLVTAGAWYAMRQFHRTGQAASPATAKPALVSPAGQGPPADPFAGKPADSWADGAAGIVLPAARPVGSYSKAVVAAAYATVKKLLIAGELTKSVLLGGRPTAFAALLAAQDRKDILDGLNATGTNKNGSPKNTHQWVSAFAPGSTELIGTVIKVRGQMTAAPAVMFHFKVLKVHVNYLFTYAIEPPGQPARWMRLIMHRQDNYYFGHWEGSTSPLTPWAESVSNEAGALCGTTDGYVHPDYAQSSIRNGPQEDPYSLKKPLPGCNASLPT